MHEYRERAAPASPGKVRLALLAVLSAACFLPHESLLNTVHVVHAFACPGDFADMTDSLFPGEVEANYAVVL